MNPTILTHLDGFTDQGNLFSIRPRISTALKEGVMLNPRIWLQGGLLLGAATVVMADNGFLTKPLSISQLHWSPGNLQHNGEGRISPARFPKSRFERAQLRHLPPGQ